MPKANVSPIEALRKRLVKAKALAGLSYEALARTYGLSYFLIMRFATGRVKKPNLLTMRAIEEMVNSLEKGKP